MRSIKFLLCLIPALLLAPVLAHNEPIAKANGIEICYETFGQKEKPALLLVMGAGGQGILWPTEFCQKLSQKGFYVIRYDQRDSGNSTCLDFAKDPYDLMDMAKDAIGLLDALQIKKAHVFGLSMGGPIAELMAVHFPERVSSIAIMGSHYDYLPVLLAFNGQPKQEGLLSSPRDKYLQEVQQIFQTPTTTDQEIIEQKIKLHNLINGSKYPLNDATIKEMQCLFVQRTVHKDSLKNHPLALAASADTIKKTHIKVSVPTVIFLGSEDPLLDSDHGKALHAAISDSTYYYVDGLGHMPNPHFYEFLADKITENTNRSN